jgi:hypothetical protein
MVLRRGELKTEKSMNGGGGGGEKALAKED